MFEVNSSCNGEERAVLGGESSPLCEPMAKRFSPNAQFWGLFHGQDFAGISLQGDLSWMKSREWAAKLVGVSLFVLWKVKYYALVLGFF